MKSSDFFSFSQLAHSVARYALGLGVAVGGVGLAIWLYAWYMGRSTDKALALAFVLPSVLIAILGSARVWLSRRELQAAVTSRVGIAHLGFAMVWGMGFASISSVAEFLITQTGLSTAPARAPGEYVLNVLAVTAACTLIAALPTGRRNGG